MTQQRLYLFTIGPVQSYIAAARRTQDLYVGSRLLSLIARCGVEKAENLGAELLFPVRLKNGRLPDGIPHRFAFISDKEIAGEIECAMQKRWKGFTKQVQRWIRSKLSSGAWESVFSQQVEHWLEVYWVAVQYDEAHHGSCYQEADRALAARKHMRYYAPFTDEPGQKCTLTGAQRALPLDWQQLKIKIGDMEHEKVLRPGEMLGSIAMIKRFGGDRFARIPDIGDNTFPDVTTIAGGQEDDDEPHYLAVLHMDGDGMGSRLSGLKTKKAHWDFSRNLAEFSQHHAPEVLKKYPPGVLVYSGGDDVLALLPLHHALACAHELYARFRDQIGSCIDQHGNEFCASAGISITPHNLPLSGALEEARIAEARAKTFYGRNALVVREAHRSGQIREAGEKWSIVPEIRQLQSLFEQGLLSKKTGYDFLDLAHDMDWGHPVRSELEQELDPGEPSAGMQRLLDLSDARKSEAMRLFNRHIQEGISKEKRQELTSLMSHLADYAEENRVGWESLSHWIILARFLSNEGKHP